VSRFIYNYAECDYSECRHAKRRCAYLSVLMCPLIDFLDDFIHCFLFCNHTIYNPQMFKNI
jgi:hypothetical protein